MTPLLTALHWFHFYKCLNGSASIYLLTKLTSSPHTTSIRFSFSQALHSSDLTSYTWSSFLFCLWSSFWNKLPPLFQKVSKNLLFSPPMYMCVFMNCCIKNGCFINTCLTFCIVWNVVCISCICLALSMVTCPLGALYLIIYVITLKSETHSKANIYLFLFVIALHDLTCWLVFVWCFESRLRVRAKKRNLGRTRACSMLQSCFSWFTCLRVVLCLVRVFIFLL